MGGWRWPTERSLRRLIKCSLGLISHGRQRLIHDLADAEDNSFNVARCSIDRLMTEIQFFVSGAPITRAYNNFRFHLLSYIRVSLKLLIRLTVATGLPPDNNNEYVAICTYNILYSNGMPYNMTVS